MMRILFSTDAVSPILGGIEGNCYRLALSMASSNEVSVLCNGKKSKEIEGVTFIDGRHGPNPFLNLLTSLRATWRISSKNTDAVICSTWRTALVAWCLSARGKVPYFVQVHGNDLLDRKQGAIKSAIEGRIRRKMLNSAAGIIANSEYTASLCRRVTVNDNIAVIHPSIGFKRVEVNSGLHEPLRLFSLSRLEERKGIQLMLSAVSSLNRRGVAVEYRIGGTGPHEKSLRQMARDLCLDNVTFLGRITEEEKAAEYAACDVFAMPSFFVEDEGSVEGFGIVFIEANMNGKPVIASNSGGIPDAVLDGRTGIVVPEKDTEALEAAIEAIANGTVSFDSDEIVQWAESHNADALCAAYFDFIAASPIEKNRDCA